jgi:guanidinopropionase
VKENQVESDEQRRAVMESVYWWGPATLFGCAVKEDPADSDIALVGVPHSSGNGSTERDQHLGPRAVRHVSNNYRRVHRQFDLNPWEEFRVNDMGDVVMPDFMVSDRAIDDIMRAYERIDAAGARPVSVGGDHSITLPILRALGRPDSRQGSGLAVVQFDAHLDTYENYGSWFGVTDSAAHWASKGAQEGCIDPSRSVQLGRRGPLSTWAAGNVSDELGYRTIEKDEFDELGVAAAIDEIRARVGTGPVYISFDLDVLDPAAAPAVSNLEPGDEGLTMKEALRLLRGMRGLNVVGADVVCLMPTKDSPNHITALNTTAILFEEICLVGEALRSSDRSVTAS